MKATIESIKVSFGIPIEAILDNNDQEEIDSVKVLKIKNAFPKAIFDYDVEKPILTFESVGCPTQEWIQVTLDNINLLLSKL